jgi:hypothetical protein
MAAAWCIAARRLVHCPFPLRKRQEMNFIIGLEPYLDVRSAGSSSCILVLQAVPVTACQLDQLPIGGAGQSRETSGVLGGTVHRIFCATAAA